MEINKPTMDHRKHFALNKKLRSCFLLAIVFICCFHAVAVSQSTLIEPIYFSNNNFTINNKYHARLNTLAKKITSDTFGYLKIIGFADTKGPANFNDILSHKRAEAVYNYLALKTNIDTTKVMVTWYGSSADIYDLHLPAANKQKRCVDIWIQFYPKKPGKH